VHGLILSGFISVIVLMLVAWGIYLFTRVGSLVDLFWALGFVVLMLVYYNLGEHSSLAAQIMLTLGLLWALRLFAYLFFYRDSVMVEDPRYTQLSSTWKIRKSLGFLSNYLLQGALMLLISSPFMIAFSDLVQFGAFFWVGAVIVVIGLVNEAIADMQLTHFKRSKHRQGNKVCQNGWWKYSRHPNYFFDWLTWLGFAVMTLAHPWGWVALISPLTLLFVFVGITINITEQHALVSRGEEYAQYQLTTSKFFPWFVRTAEQK